jgi:hypothetical protein
MADAAATGPGWHAAPSRQQLLVRSALDDLSFARDRDDLGALLTRLAGEGLVEALEVDKSDVSVPVALDPRGYPGCHPEPPSTPPAGWPDARTWSDPSGPQRPLQQCPLVAFRKAGRGFPCTRNCAAS